MEYSVELFNYSIKYINFTILYIILTFLSHFSTLSKRIIRLKDFHYKLAFILIGKKILCDDLRWQTELS